MSLSKRITAVAKAAEQLRCQSCAELPAFVVTTSGRDDGDSSPLPHRCARCGWEQGRIHVEYVREPYANEASA